MRIEQVTAFLYALKPRGIRFGLENTRLVLEKLGLPQKNFRVIHIAGSNGKGSTAAFIDSILRQAGVKTGLYTSPHLSHYRERFRIDGKEIHDEVIEEAADQLLSRGLELDPEEVTAWIQNSDLVAKMDAGNWYDNRGEASQFCRLTFFECTTILATQIFARCGVDIAIMECGMGGRLDATNVFEPLLCAITPIALEHTEWLGDTLEAIAAEKAGIIKPGIDVVCARQADPAREVIVETAKRVGAPLQIQGTDFAGMGNWQEARFRSGDRQLGPVKLGLVGAHQVDNAALASHCVNLLRANQILVDDRAWREGLEGVNWPARFERFGSRGEWVVDGAHNPDGVRVLVEAVREVFGDRKLRVVFGVLGEKDAGPMLEWIESIAGHIDLVLPSDARGRNPESLQTYLQGSATVHNSVGEALGIVIQETNDPVLITGSLTVAGEARVWIQNRGMRPWLRKNA